MTVVPSQAKLQRSRRSLRARDVNRELLRDRTCIANQRGFESFASCLIFRSSASLNVTACYSIKLMVHVQIGQGEFIAVASIWAIRTSRKSDIDISDNAAMNCRTILIRRGEPAVGARPFHPIHPQTMIAAPKTTDTAASTTLW